MESHRDIYTYTISNHQDDLFSLLPSLVTSFTQLQDDFDLYQDALNQ